MSTLQTVTPIQIADGVAAEITTPADSTVWSIQEFTCKRTYLPTPKEADLQTLQVAVIPMYRGRGRHRGDNARPTPGRETRGQVRSSHWIKIVFQQLVGVEPANTVLDALASFACQVDDYWHVAHRKLNAVPGITGSPTQVIPMDSEIEIWSPKDLDERGLWVAMIDCTFSEVTLW